MSRPTFTVVVDATYATVDVRPDADVQGHWRKATGRVLREDFAPEVGLLLQVAYRVSCLNAQNAIHFALALLEKDMGKTGAVSPHARPVSLRVVSDLSDVSLPDEQVAA